MRNDMSKLQNRLVETLEVNNRVALELVKISFLISKMEGPNKTSFEKDALNRLTTYVNSLAERISEENAKTIALLEGFP